MIHEKRKFPYTTIGKDNWAKILIWNEENYGLYLSRDFLKVWVKILMFPAIIMTASYMCQILRVSYYLLTWFRENVIEYIFQIFMHYMRAWKKPSLWHTLRRLMRSTYVFWISYFCSPTWFHSNFAGIEWNTHNIISYMII